MRARIAGIVKESVSDGPGLRIVVFFQGCEHHCQGCHNPQTWPHDGGVEYELEEFITGLPDTPLIRGITLSGGDPFFQAAAATAIAQDFRNRGKDVWTYTGYKWEELLQQSDDFHLSLINASDVVIDGPYIEAMKDTASTFRGSTNQRLIAVDKSLKSGKVVHWQDENAGR